MWVGQLQSVSGKNEIRIGMVSDLLGMYRWFIYIYHSCNHQFSKVAVVFH